jgi:lysophospholipase L1-like esterase
MIISMKILSCAFALTIALLLTFVSPTGIEATPTVPAPVDTPASAASPAPAAPLAPMTIMELGDSITAGVGPKGVDNGRAGYRLPLTRLLEAGGYDFKMVGSRSDYSGTLQVGDHEGWPGYVLRSFPSDPAPQLLGPVTSKAIATYHPSVILLMAGTNDLLRLARHSKDYTQANIAHSLDMELAEIFGLEPSARVIVAGVVDSPRVPHAAVVAFAGDVATLVSRYRAHGFRVEQADGMSSAVPRDARAFPDGIHPATLGYDSMAAVWFKALGAALAQWPNPVVKAAGGPTVARTADGQPQH